MGRNSLSAENGDSSKGGSFSGQTQRGLNQRIRVIDNLQEAGRAVGVVSNQGGKEKRRMVGHVEEDDLWKMKRAFDDVRDMGLFPNMTETVVNSAKGKSSRAKDQSEEESFRDFFLKLSVSEY
ncbi:hypothetical protein V6N11_078918 [Hibiscus sabdariffa]|uniref:Uncharacterized protein n=1 Tax=Hibiscus sabdariffa TaxID=183260 RepID=A0ABR2RUE7_9ROSI